MEVQDIGVVVVEVVIVLVVVYESVVMEVLLVEMNICAVDFLKKIKYFYTDELLSSRLLASIHFTIT